jgi:hypothetical protein
MLKKKANPTFSHSFDVTIAGGESHRVTAEFRHMRKDAADDHFKDRSNKLAEKLAAVIVKWDGIEGDPTEEGMRELDQEYPSLCPQLLNAYIDALVFGRSGN